MTARVQRTHHLTFELDEQVYWTDKRPQGELVFSGKVMEVVPPGVVPKTRGLILPGRPKKYTSYVIWVEKPNVVRRGHNTPKPMWPRVADLRKGLKKLAVMNAIRYLNIDPYELGDLRLIKHPRLLGENSVWGFLEDAMLDGPL